VGSFELQVLVIYCSRSWYHYQQESVQGQWAEDNSLELLAMVVAPWSDWNGFLKSLIVRLHNEKAIHFLSWTLFDHGNHRDKR
jgi:hypothetical protein